jgi:aminoglycoside phosphotransferase (APT) family kinase protein
MDADLARWVEEELGRPIGSSWRTAGGGSRTTWLVDLADGDDPRSVVVRTEGEGSFTGTEISLAREMVAFRALGPTPVAVPRVHAVRADGSAAILERLDGTDDLAQVPEQERAAIMDDFAAVLACLHRVDPDELELPGFARPTTAEEHARLDLQMWQRLASTVDALDPLIAYCGAWLVEHAPTSVARTTFVQGDTGPGNFMAAQGRVTGLVDMEFAHLGDPMDDVAWVLMRLRGATSPEEFLAAYLRHGGVPIEHASVDFYRLAVDYRCAVTTSLAVGRGGGARGWAPYLLQTQRYLDGIAERLAALAGLDRPPLDDPDPPPTPRTPMFDQLLESIRAAVRAIDDDEIRTATRNDQILVHYLRAHDRLGVVLEQSDRADRRAVAGIPDDHRALVEHAAAAGATGDVEALAYLLRRQRRDRLLWRTLLDR